MGGGEDADALAPSPCDLSPEVEGAGEGGLALLGGDGAGRVRPVRADDVGCPPEGRGERQGVHDGAGGLGHRRIGPVRVGYDTKAGLGRDGIEQQGPRLVAERPDETVGIDRHTHALEVTGAAGGEPRVDSSRSRYGGAGSGPVDVDVDEEVEGEVSSEVRRLLLFLLAPLQPHQLEGDRGTQDLYWTFAGGASGTQVGRGDLLGRLLLRQSALAAVAANLDLEEIFGVGLGDGAEGAEGPAAHPARGGGGVLEREGNGLGHLTDGRLERPRGRG